MVAPTQPQISADSVALEVSTILSLLQTLAGGVLSHSEVRAVKRRLRRLMREELTHPSRHHRLARDNGGTDEESNISIVPWNLHEHFHGLFGTSSPEEIAKVLTDVWVDPSYEIVACRRYDKGRR